MKSFCLAALLVVFILLTSCSSLAEIPEPNESRILLFVAEFHKPLVAPTATLQIEGLPNPVQVPLKAPLAVFSVPAADTWRVVGFDVDKTSFTSGFEAFEFIAPGATVSLLPVKVTIINKSRIEIQDLSDLDLSYVKGQLMKNRRYSEIPVLYPELSLPEK